MAQKGKKEDRTQIDRFGSAFGGDGRGGSGLLSGC